MINFKLVVYSFNSKTRIQVDAFSGAEIKTIVTKLPSRKDFISRKLTKLLIQLEKSNLILNQLFADSVKKKKKTTHIGKIVQTKESKKYLIKKNCF